MKILFVTSEFADFAQEIAALAALMGKQIG